MPLLPELQTMEHPAALHLRWHQREEKSQERRRSDIFVAINFQYVSSSARSGICMPGNFKNVGDDEGWSTLPRRSDRRRERLRV
jgi:hypothetical protein